jgi:hypothetical protein
MRCDLCHGHLPPAEPEKAVSIPALNMTSCIHCHKILTMIAGRLTLELLNLAGVFVDYAKMELANRSQVTADVWMSARAQLMDRARDIERAMLPAPIPPQT